MARYLLEKKEKEKGKKKLEKKEKEKGEKKQTKRGLGAISPRIEKKEKEKGGKKLRGALSVKNVRKAQKRKEKKKIECADCRCLRRDGVHGFRD